MSLQGRVSLLAVVFCALVFSPLTASAATNMYIKFEEPAVPGTSTASGHGGEIEILSWNHGFVQPTSATRGGGGQATHQNLSFTKYLDSASDELIKSAWSGKQFAKATVTCYRSDGARDNKPVSYLEIVMQHVIISNYSVSGGPGDIPVENVSLDYGIIEYRYIDQKRDDGSPMSVKANKKTGTIE